MPSKTFLNLSKEKKVKFIKESLMEFSNHSLKDASINKIVKQANIARGSFYQYFDDIYDLYDYILEVSREKLDMSFIKSIKKTKDIRKTFIEYFNTLLEYGSKKSNIKYFHNVFLDMTFYKIKNDFNKRKQELICLILSNIDKAKINKVGKDYFIFIVESLYIETINSAMEVFVYHKNKKQVIEEYTKRIEFITTNMYI